MEDKELQYQIDALNKKVDLILEHLNAQKQSNQIINDLVSDVSIIGKDVYDSTVEELDKNMVNVDTEELKMLIVKLLKNVNNFNNMLGMLESLNDFVKDASPIANEILIDFTEKLNEFDKKGYFEFFREAGNIIDNIVTNYSKEDVKQLADNVVTIVETLKNATQPDVMNSLNNAIKTFRSIDINNVPEYSMWQLFKEMNKPEMKRSIGFMVTFLNSISKK